MTETAVQYELQDRVAVVTIDDGKANAISHQVAADVHDALGRARDEAGAVVLTGRPGRFSAGFDLATMTSSDEAARELLRVGAELALELYGFPTPVVVAATGHALAMGAILLLSGDVRIGAEGPFKIGLNEVAIGMPVPGFAVELGRARLAPAAFTDAINLATVYDPEGAVGAGFLDRTVAADDTVAAAVAHAAELAERVRPKAFVATRATCRAAQVDAMRHGLATDVATFTVELPAD
jgi:enoyl-CoA hydratase